MTQKQPNPKFNKPKVSYPKLPKMRYVLVEWPEIQDFMTNPRWNECILCIDIEGHTCPDSIYAVPEDLYNAVTQLDYKMNDRVEHPSHYTWLKKLCGIEAIDITRNMNFNLGCALKYILRAGHKEEEGMSIKEKQIEDLEKAVWYLTDEINRIKNTD